ncbi:MAG: hypothetical protein ABW170_10615 [Candidatus Thiodiazotropha sp. L084R]
MNREIHARFYERLRGKLPRSTHQGRFKSQALLDDAALFTCMSYVDLNPIRAGIAETPENSEYTSIEERIRTYHKTLNQTGCKTKAQIKSPKGLVPFTGGEHQEKQNGLCFNLTDYFQLTDWAGRAIREDKSGAIPSHLSPILERLGIDSEAWLDTVRNYNNNYYTVVGTREGINKYRDALGRKWFCSTKITSQLYQSSIT